VRFAPPRPAAPAAAAATSARRARPPAGDRGALAEADPWPVERARASYSAPREPNAPPYTPLGLPAAGPPRWAYGPDYSDATAALIEDRHGATGELLLGARAARSAGRHASREGRRRPARADSRSTPGMRRRSGVLC